MISEEFFVHFIAFSNITTKLKTFIGNNEFIECLVSVEGKHPSSLKCDVKYEVPFSSADRFLHIEATFNVSHCIVF